MRDWLLDPAWRPRVQGGVTVVLVGTLVFLAVLLLAGRGR